MRELVLLKIGEMVGNQSRGESITFALHFESRQQTFSDIARPTPNRVKMHDSLPCILNNLLGPTTHRRNFFIRGVEPAVGVEIADYADGRVTYIPFDRTHVKLPLEMIGKRWSPGKKLFKGGGILFVFDLLRLITRVEVILKLSPKINFLKSIARGFLTHQLVANGILTQVSSNRLTIAPLSLGLTFNTHLRQRSGIS